MSSFDISLAKSKFKHIVEYIEYIYSPLRQNTPRNKYKKANTKNTQYVRRTYFVVLIKKSEHLYSALYRIQTTLKRSGMDHTVLPAINTIPAVYLVSVHQMAPPPIEVANI